MIKRYLTAALCAAAFAWAPPVHAQQAKLPSTNVSGTIAVTNTFQSVFEAGFRTGCTVQNNGAASMWVFFGPIASATKAKSVILATGQSVSCNSPGITLSDQISITGTATQEFFAAVQ
jgi:hypothetical protein